MTSRMTRLANSAHLPYNVRNWVKISFRSSYVMGIQLLTMVANAISPGRRYW